MRLRLTPSGGVDRIDGRSLDADGHTLLKARVRAAPEDGKANKALEALIAKTLGVAKSNVQVTRGQTARIKTLQIEGVDQTELDAFIAALPEL